MLVCACVCLCVGCGCLGCAAVVADGSAQAESLREHPPDAEPVCSPTGVADRVTRIAPIASGVAGVAGSACCTRTARAACGSEAVGSRAGSSGCRWCYEFRGSAAAQAVGARGDGTAEKCRSRKLGGGAAWGTARHKPSRSAPRGQSSSDSRHCNAGAASVAEQNDRGKFSSRLLIRPAGWNS